jgi:hypothetical protein
MRQAAIALTIAAAAGNGVGSLTMAEIPKLRMPPTNIERSFSWPTFIAGEVSALKSST